MVGFEQVRLKVNSRSARGADIEGRRGKWILNSVSVRWSHACRYIKIFVRTHGELASMPRRDILQTLHRRVDNR